MRREKSSLALETEQSGYVIKTVLVAIQGWLLDWNELLSRNWKKNLDRDNSFKKNFFGREIREMR